VKTSEKHRHSQALLAMSVFVFLGQDGVGKTSFAGFCQVKSRQKECPVTDFKARTGAFYFG
jgi:putative ribosome biogenesis GTPase RsgA